MSLQVLWGRLLPTIPSNRPNRWQQHPLKTRRQTPKQDHGRTLLVRTEWLGERCCFVYIFMDGRHENMGWWPLLLKYKDWPTSVQALLRYYRNETNSPTVINKSFYYKYVLPLNCLGFTHIQTSQMLQKKLHINSPSRHPMYKNLIWTFTAASVSVRTHSKLILIPFVQIQGLCGQQCFVSVIFFRQLVHN